MYIKVVHKTFSIYKHVGTVLKEQIRAVTINTIVLVTPTNFMRILNALEYLISRQIAVLLRYRL